MGEYITTVAVASCIIGLLEYLCYSSKTKETVRACALVLVLHAVLVPILSFASTVKNGELDISFDNSFETVQDSEYEKVAKEAFKEGVCKLLFSKYGIKEEDAEIVIEGFEPQKMKADKITIILSGKGALADHRALREYITEAGLGECEVRVRIG